MTTYNNSCGCQGDASDEHEFVNQASPEHVLWRFLALDGTEFKTKEGTYNLSLHKMIEQEHYSLEKGKTKPISEYLTSIPTEVQELDNFKMLDRVFQQAYGSAYLSEYRSSEFVTSFIRAVLHELVDRASGTKEDLPGRLYFPYSANTIAVGRWGSQLKCETPRVGYPVYFGNQKDFVKEIVKDTDGKRSALMVDESDLQVPFERLMTYDQLIRHVALSKSDKLEEEWQKHVAVCFREVIGEKEKVSNKRIGVAVHSCRCFSMKYLRYSFLLRNEKDGHYGLMSNENLAVSNYTRMSMEKLNDHWEEFIVEGYSVIPQMKGQSHNLYEGYALEIQLDEELYSKFNAKEAESGK